MKRSLKLLGVVLAVTVVGGCSDSEPSESTTPSSAGGSLQSGTTAPQAPATADRKVIAATGDPAAESGGIEIYSLTRESPRLVTLRFGLVNKGAKDVSTANRFGESPSGSRDVSGAYLVDPDGLKKYLTVLDADRACLCSTNLFAVRPGQRLELFATFAAPPPEVKTVTIVVPSFQPLTGIPVS